MPLSTINSTVMVGMSGGVDSAVSAKILLDQGYNVQGLFMKNWEEDDGSEYCTARQDLADAQAVCDHLGIDLHEANFAAEYWDNVFEQFLAEYKAGRTPNPDVLCNREIKFNVFRQYAGILGAQYIATGHYVRVQKTGNSTQLLKGLDPRKDQSYFLQSVTADQLSNCIFPVGELEKTKVRQIAAESEIPTHAKKDSTGICFIGERRFRDFLQRYIPAKPGAIRTREGSLVGEHQGVSFYTIGQRQGLGVGGIRNASDAPWYVFRKDVTTNTLYVVQGNQHKSLYSSAMRCNHINWIDGYGPALPAKLAVKTRYRQSDQACVVSRRKNSYHITFDTPQRAVTPGQWACFYETDRCLGGGIIDSTVAATSETETLSDASYESSVESSALRRAP